MIPVAKALQIVLDQTTSLPAESVALVDALGRILAEDIVADTDLPPFDRAQMDGYAIRAADVANTPARLRIVGESAAGNGWHHEMKAGEAVRIMTGAPVPAESVALVDALGRILAEDIVADTDLPPFDRAQMDGYAIRAADVANTPARLRIVGESAAGNGWHHEMKAGEAVRIMTGAPVPA